MLGTCSKHFNARSLSRSSLFKDFNNDEFGIYSKKTSGQTIYSEFETLAWTTDYSILPFQIKVAVFYRYGTIFRQVMNFPSLRFCEIMEGIDKNPYIKMSMDVLSASAPKLFQQCPFAVVSNVSSSWLFRLIVNYILNIFRANIASKISPKTKKTFLRFFRPDFTKPN